MDACSDPGIHTVVVMKSAQIGYTEILLNIIGYFIAQDPSPILLIQPTLELGETFSKTRLAPMLRDTPCLRGKVADARSRDSGNTLLSKSFPGGNMAIAGANSPAGLASRPIRVVLCDEVDRYPASAGPEGDPVNLARKRATTFHNRKIILGSTPTIRGASRIELAYEQSDRRQYHVPCPHCGQRQPLIWAQVQWPDHAPEQAAYVCAHCGSIWDEPGRRRAIQSGEWLPQSPTAGIAGFHLNELYSPWRTPAAIAIDFLAAKQSPETLKTWINTSLGETWEEKIERSDPALLAARRENYGGDSLPAGILWLTAGVDVQDDRLECEVVGWRREDRDAPPESWGIEYRVFTGDPARQAVWVDLDQFLQQSWRTADGRTLRLGAVCLDSGGHHTAQAYAFAEARRGRHIYATKGRDGDKPLWPLRASKSLKYRAQVWIIGVDAGKSTWYSRLRITEPGPGYCHFPTAYPETYFAGLVAEVIKVRYRNGRAMRVYELPAGKRNEPLDIRVLALAALSAHPPPWQQITTALANRGQEPAPQAKPVSENSWLRHRPGTGGDSWLRRR
jgi:phage terminase large subunit GpA-like protein